MVSKIMYKLIGFTFLIMLFACKNEKHKFYSNNCVKTDRLDHGELFEYIGYDNFGNKIINFHTNKNNEIMGNAFEYYPNGNLKNLCFFYNDSLQGESIDKFEDGKIENINFYDDDKLVEVRLFEYKGDTIVVKIGEQEANAVILRSKITYLKSFIIDSLSFHYDFIDFKDTLRAREDAKITMWYPFKDTVSISILDMYKNQLFNKEFISSGNIDSFKINDLKPGLYKIRGEIKTYFELEGINGLHMKKIPIYKNFLVR